jgi:hypothetical protein
MISVTIDSPSLDLGAQWDDLILRATPNAFMNPAALRAANDSHFARIGMILAWHQGGGPRRLVGVWALQRRRLVPCWPEVLEALPYNYAFLSNPVVDPGHVDEVMPVLLAAVEMNPHLPKMMNLMQFDADAPSYSATMAALSARGIAPLMLSASSRPFVTTEFGVKRSGATRKKLRQDWNRLSALGSVEITNERSPAAVLAAFETFLAMEQASWKGARGTALLSHANDAAFARNLLHNLAAVQCASVALLRVDGEAVAAQVLMYCGTTAFTWKTAFDARFGKYSPGTLLVDKITDQLLTEGGIQAINSCAAEDSFMAQLWAGRRPMVDMLVDVRAGHSLGYRMEAGRQLGYRMLRRLRDHMRHRRAVPSAAQPPKAALAEIGQKASPALGSPVGSGVDRHRAEAERLGV